MKGRRQEPQTGQIRRFVTAMGLAMLMTGAMLFGAVMAGLMPETSFSIGGASGFKSIAAVAVVGCIMAAIGYADYD